MQIYARKLIPPRDLVEHCHASIDQPYQHPSRRSTQDLDVAGTRWNSPWHHKLYKI